MVSRLLHLLYCIGFCLSLGGPSAQAGTAQDLELGLPPVQDFTPPDFFASNRRHDLQQDSRGRIYYAEDTALRIFDGSRYRKIALDGQRGIHGFTVLADDRVLLARDQDVLILSPNATHDFDVMALSSRFPPEIRREIFSRQINTHALLGDTLYLGNLHAIYQAQGNQVRRIFESERFVPLIFTHAGRLVLSSSQRGLLVWNPERDIWDSIPGGEVLQDAGVGTVLGHTEDQDGALMLFTNHGGVWRYDGQRAELLFQTAGTLQQAMMATTGGTRIGERIYLETSGHGIYVFSRTGERLQIIDRSNALRDHDLYQLLADRQGALWVHSRGGLLRLGFDSTFERYANTEGVQTESISQVFRNNGQLYAMTSRRLMRGQPIPGTHAIRLAAVPTLDRVTYGSGAGNHGVLFLSGNGLWCARDGAPFQIAEYKGNYTTVFSSHLESNIYYLASPTELVRFSYDGRTYTELGKIEGNYAYASRLHEVTPGRFYLEVGIGRLVFCDWSTPTPKQSFFDGRDGLPADEWIAPFPHTNGWRFRCAKSGILRHDGVTGRFVMDRDLDRLFPMPLQSIRVLGYDAAGLWVSSSEGNGFLTPDAAGQYHWQALDLRELDQRIINSVHRESASAWIGTNYGLLRWKPQSTPPPPRPLLASIDRVLSADQDWRSMIAGGPPAIRLSSDTGHLRIEFSATDMDAPEQVIYGVTLCRGNQSYIRQASPTPFVEYAFLPPGNYHLEIQPRRDGGRVGPAVTYAFSVAGAWRQSHWPTGLALGGLGAAVVIVGWWLRRKA